MKQSNEEIDKLIHEALSEEEAKFYDDLGEQSIFEMVSGVFQGRNKWIHILSWILSIIFLGIFIYSMVKFFKATETREMLIWMVIGFYFLSSTKMK